MGRIRLGSAAICACLEMFASIASVEARPPDDVIDEALECLDDVQVRYFRATPSTTAPFSSTRLSWDVYVPPGCGSLEVAGQRVAKKGSLVVTPVHHSSSYPLQVRVVGGAVATLATRTVTVDQTTCNATTIPAFLLAPQLQEMINTVDAEVDEFYQTDQPVIELRPGGLFITMFVGIEVDFWPDPTETLEMGLRFTVRDGVVYPSWMLFRPAAYASEAGELLAAMRVLLNEQLAEFVPEGQKLFDLVPVEDGLVVTLCRDPNFRPPVASPIDIGSVLMTF